MTTSVTPYLIKEKAFELVGDRGPVSPAWDRALEEVRRYCAEPAVAAEPAAVVADEGGDDDVA